MATGGRGTLILSIVGKLGKALSRRKTWSVPHCFKPVLREPCRWQKCSSRIHSTPSLKQSSAPYYPPITFVWILKLPQNHLKAGCCHCCKQINTEFASIPDLEGNLKLTVSAQGTTQVISHSEGISYSASPVLLSGPRRLDQGRHQGSRNTGRPVVCEVARHRALPSKVNDSEQIAPNRLCFLQQQQQMVAGLEAYTQRNVMRAEL